LIDRQRRRRLEIPGPRPPGSSGLRGDREDRLGLYRARRMWRWPRFLGASEATLNIISRRQRPARLSDIPHADGSPR